MSNFIFQVFSENGNPSSKRVICFILLFLYSFVLLYNLFTGKKPDDTIEVQLYYMLVTNLGIILGSNIVDAVKTVKTTQAESNVKVGAPSPTPAPVVAAAPATTIIN